jgi:hypothetical protein
LTFGFTPSRLKEFAGGFMLMKVCNKCGVEKELSLFGKAKTNKDGRRHACTPCRVEMHREKRQANPEKHKEYHKAYRQKHLERKKAYDKKWAEQNRDAKLSYQKNWRTENSERIKKQIRNWVEQNRDRYNEINRKYTKTRRRIDTQFRLAGRLRARLLGALRKGQKKRLSRP